MKTKTVYRRDQQGALLNVYPSWFAGLFTGFPVLQKILFKNLKTMKQ